MIRDTGSQAAVLGQRKEILFLDAERVWKGIHRHSLKEFRLRVHRFRIVSVHPPRTPHADELYMQALRGAPHSGHKAELTSRNTCEQKSVLDA
jgi:hypothetical protein